MVCFEVAMLGEVNGLDVHQASAGFNPASNNGMVETVVVKRTLGGVGWE